MVVVGTAIAIISMRNNFASGNEGALSFFAIPAGEVLVFPILVTPTLVWRRQAVTHKRLTPLATVSVLDAAIAQWPRANGERARNVLRGDRFVHRGGSCF